MNVKKIKKSIDIKAPQEKVWQVLFGEKTYSIWASAFSDGAFVKTDWQEGSKVVFSDNSNSGLFGTIVKNVPNEYLLITYDGSVMNGEEDIESEEAKMMKGMEESYTLSQYNGMTHLEIQSDMGESYFDMMSASWNKALEKVKEMAEAK